MSIRRGFENLLRTGVDIVQPDIHWCGGLTELLKIKAMASAKNRLCVLHGSSVYSYHFAITSDATPFSEFLMMAPQADKDRAYVHAAFHRRDCADQWPDRRQ